MGDGQKVISELSEGGRKGESKNIEEKSRTNRNREWSSADKGVENYGEGV